MLANMPNNIQIAKKSWLHGNVVRLARLHFLYVVAFTVQTVIYDSWKLIAPNAVLYRWIVSASLLVITTFVWYVAKSHISSTAACRLLVWTLIIVDIAAASFNVYSQRGMASLAVALYTIPIIVAAVLRSRAAIFAAATLAVAAYSSTAIAYFVLNFNEGYKIQLYGDVGFYCAIFFVIAGLLAAVVRPVKAQ
ncbi:MAG: hypothetical protein JWS12_831 [Candidatus Saccharibacteria bacterium]|nr:hypothetical protein [Candidatus Saccharibacteria bacterium]